MKYISYCLSQSLFNGLVCVQALNAVQNHQINGEINAETSWALVKHQVPEFTFAYKRS